MTPALLLFDIDGTLVQRASRAHAEALLVALGRVYAVADPTAVRVEAAGRTDLEIARQILVHAGVREPRLSEGFGDLRAATAEEYAHRCPGDLSDHVVAGVPALLEELAARDDVRLSLVTGNLEPVARLKLARAGLGAFFPRGQGGFGSDDEDRAALPPLARARAGDHPRERTWVIGDTPRDIACAQADGLRVLAVTTGPYAAAELSAADGVASGPDELRSLLAAELGV